MNIQQYVDQEMNINRAEYEAAEYWKGAGKKWELIRRESRVVSHCRYDGDGNRLRGLESEIVSMGIWEIPGIVQCESEGEPDPIPSFEEWVEIRRGRQDYQELLRCVESWGSLEAYFEGQKKYKQKWEAEKKALNGWDKREAFVEGFKIEFQFIEARLSIWASKVGTKSCLGRSWHESKWKDAEAEYPRFLEELPQLQAEWEEAERIRHEAWLREREAEKAKYAHHIPACERLAKSLEAKGYCVRREGADPRKWSVKGAGTTGDTLISRAKREKLLIPKSLL